MIAAVPVAALLVSLIPALRAWQGSRKQGLSHANPQ
jgi:putative ABC transport system permease protein